MKADSVALIKGLVRLSKRLNEIVLRDFEPLTNGQLNWSAGPNEWSIAACLLHINLSFSYYLPLMEAEIFKSKTSPKSQYQSGFLGNFLVKRIQLADDNIVRHPLKVSKLFKPGTESELNGQEIIQQHELFQHKLQHLLMASNQVNLETIRIPWASLSFIRLRLGDLFRYLVYHNERHLVQAQRVRSEEQFPRTTANEGS